MKAPDGYVVPPTLRGARFVRRQPGTRRAPMRVTPRAFELAGLAVPADRQQWNVYRLTERRGEEWSPAVDAHIARFGAELLGGREFVCGDADQHLAIDGGVWLDGLHWLADAGAAVGELLDITQPAAVRTPGDPDRRHGPGWHLWYRADPEYPVQFGALKRCPAIEIKNRCTAPGSPNYVIQHAPTALPVLPRWIAELAGPPRPVAVPAPATGNCSPTRAWRRICGMTDRLANQKQPGRNNLLYGAARLAGELGIEYAPAEAALLDACTRNGLMAEDGELRCKATIRNGYAVGAGAQTVAHA